MRTAPTVVTDPFFNTGRREFMIIAGAVAAGLALNACSVLDRQYNDDPYGVTLDNETLPRDTRPLNNTALLSDTLRDDTAAAAEALGRAGEIQIARRDRAYEVAADIYDLYRREYSSVPDPEREIEVDETTLDGREVIEFRHLGPSTGWITTAIFARLEGEPDSNDPRVRPDLNNLVGVRVQLVSEGFAPQDPNAPVRTMALQAADHADGSRSWHLRIENPQELDWYRLPPEIADDLADTNHELELMQQLGEQTFLPAISTTDPGDFR